MQCHVCQSSEFICHDGVYFCTECNSQKEASRKEQSEQESGFSNKSLIQPSPKNKKKALKKQNLLAPWIIADGYNVILHKQVLALISLGASENLKNVVLYIWSKYLQKCEVAFRTDHKADSDNRVPRLSAFLRQRDVKVLYGDRDITKKYRSKKKAKGCRKLKVESDNEETDASEWDDMADSEANISDVEDQSNVSSDDSPSSTVKRSISYKLSYHALKLQETVGTLKLKRSNEITRDLCVHHMTLCKTLCFCYLGLLYTEDQLLLCDLLRLVREGKIPYIDTRHCFPASMPLQADDYFHFNSNSVPSNEKISKLSAKLFEFLELPKFKHPPYMPIVVRFVKDLNLPDGIIPIIHTLYNKMEDSHSLLYATDKRIPQYGIQAMALIVISLKLIFVLDGKFELEHSRIMTKINVLLNGQKLFVWEDWKSQMLLKEYLFLKDGCSYSDLSNLDCLSADEIIRKYPITRLKDLEDNTYLKKSQKNTQLMGRREIKTLLEDIGKLKDEASFDKASSFPLMYELSRFMTEGASWKMFSETQKRDFTFLKKSFSNDMMFYKQTEEVDKESNELICILLSSLYEATELLYLCKESSNYQNIIKTSSKYWYKKITCDELREVKQVWCEKLPASFVWVLKLLSKYLQVSCDELYGEIQTLEKELLFS